MTYTRSEIPARKAADNLCRRLGEGWKPYVHENLGWYYSATKGFITVYEYIQNDPEKPNYPAYYTASISPNETFGYNEGKMGLSVQIFVDYFYTPNEAVEAVLSRRDAVAADLERIADILLKIEG